jgi:hypothetical protein
MVRTVTACPEPEEVFAMPSLSRFFRAALGAGLALLMVSSTVFAQYYYQPVPRYHPAPRYLPEPIPGTGGFSPRPRYYEEDDYDYRPRRRPQPRAEYGYERRGAGSVCVTSRGECSVGRYVPIGTGCKCQIPGFGQKRGHVQY